MNPEIPKNAPAEERTNAKTRKAANLSWMLPPPQFRRFLSWVGYSVVLPLMAYLAFVIFALWDSHPDAVGQLLAKGEILFLAIVHLATAVDWSLIALQRRTRKAQEADILGHLFHVLSITLIVLFSTIFGGLLLMQLPSVPEIGSVFDRAFFCLSATALSLIGCGGLYYHLLRCKHL